MSGFTTGITGFAPPNTIAGFMGLLQAASFRGVPFKVVAAMTKKGRRQAIHEYPYVDGGWPEDMGRSLRMYSFSGYLIGDVAPVMQLLLDNAVEQKGPGLLIHPTLGALQVAVESASTAVHKDKMRVIEVALQFIEAGGNLFPLTVIATAVEVLAAADFALTAIGTDLGNAAIPAAAAGPAVTGEGQAVVVSFGAAALVGGANPTALVGMAAALPPPDMNTTYGRYGAGSASVSLPIGTTVASLQSQLANQRAALALAVAGASSAAASYSASTDMSDALAALVEAMRAGMTDPADQVQVLLGLAGFTFLDGAGGSVGIGAAMATMRDAMAAACRRAALVSLARASASYQPSSYNDAAALRASLSAALGTEITAAGDAGEDASYLALRSLRASVIQDLTVRGASLPSVVTVNFAMSLPSLVIAHTLYLDSSRSDQITAESGAIHPAFCPTTFQALASGTAATVNPSYDLSNNAGVPLMAPAKSTGVYRLPVPGQVVGLTVGSITSSSVSLGWSAPVSGGSPSGYVVQQSAHGAGIWSTAGETGALTTAFTVTGLTSNTALDFEVYAVNASGSGTVSALVTATSLLNPPNAVSGLVVAGGSPPYSVMDLSWTASATDGTHDAAATYTPQYRVTGSGSWLTFGSPIAGTSVSVTGLTHATPYDFQVIATNTGGTATSSTATRTTDYAPPNVPVISSVAPATDGTTSKLTATWAASAVDGTHDAATSYNVRSSVHSAGSWTTVTGVTSPYTITGLTAGTSYDVEVQAANASSRSPSAWSSATTASTYSIALTYGLSGSPRTSFTHGSGNINGVSNAGMNIDTPGTPPPPTSVYLDATLSNTTIPISGLTSVSYADATHQWAAFYPVPGSAGTYYLWALAKDGSSNLIGALVSAAIAVT